MIGPPRQLTRPRLLAALFLPLGLYVVLRVVTGSAIEALALTETIPAAGLVVTGLRRRHIDALGVLSTVTVAIAFLAYALTGDDPIALKLRHGAVTGAFGVALLASLALGRPLLVVIVQRRAELDQERRAEIEARLADPVRRRALVVMTLLVGLAMTLDGVAQTTIALTVPTDAFVALSTIAHIVVLGGGAGALLWYSRYRYQRQRRLTLDR